MDTLLLAVITIVPLLLCVAFLLFYIKAQLHELHLSMNSRMDELLDTARLLARAEGFKAGQDDHRMDAIKDAGDRASKPTS